MCIGPDFPAEGRREQIQGGGGFRTGIFSHEKISHRVYFAQWPENPAGNSIAFGSAPRREADSQPISQLDRPAVSQTETHSLGFLSVVDTGPGSGETRWSQDKQWPNGNAGRCRLFGRRFEPRSGEKGDGDPQKGGYTTPAPALDLTTSLRGDFAPFQHRIVYYWAVPALHCQIPAGSRIVLRISRSFQVGILHFQGVPA